ncbi:MAG: PEGA domain-containing protein, partial [Deltaproteobacteria bacterium]|nr:PEGA domain-containing protein [Deltaproteobacteria bacterium]
PLVIENVPVGERYEIRVAKEGFRPWVKTVELEDDKPVTIQASLERLLASIGVKSTPSGASVFLDDKKMNGSPPIEIPDVSAGDAHKITVKKKGYATGVETVTLKPDERKEVGIALQPLLGEVRISSDPSGARVYLDDRDMVRKTPTRLSGLSPGTYQLRLKKEGYKVWEDKVVVRASEALDLPRVKLQKAFGRLNLHVSPWAHVYHKGKKLGTTPLANIPFQVGTHKLVLKNPHLKIEKEVPVTIVADKINTKTVDLMEGIKGKLKIKVIPWADVYVDGKRKGTTPLKSLELAAGEHTVLVQNRRLGAERSFRVMIKPNEVVSKEVNLLEKE